MADINTDVIRVRQVLRSNGINEQVEDDFLQNLLTLYQNDLQRVDLVLLDLGRHFGRQLFVEEQRRRWQELHGDDVVVVEDDDEQMEAVLWSDLMVNRRQDPPDPVPMEMQAEPLQQNNGLGSPLRRSRVRFLLLGSTTRRRNAAIQDDENADLSAMDVGHSATTCIHAEEQRQSPVGPSVQQHIAGISFQDHAKSSNAAKTSSRVPMVTPGPSGDRSRHSQRPSLAPPSCRLPYPLTIEFHRGNLETSASVQQAAASRAEGQGSPPMPGRGYVLGTGPAASAITASTSSAGRETGIGRQTDQTVDAKRTIPQMVSSLPGRIPGQSGAFGTSAGNTVGAGAGNVKLGAAAARDETAAHEGTAGNGLGLSAGSSPAPLVTPRTETSTPVQTQSGGSAAKTAASPTVANISKRNPRQAATGPTNIKLEPGTYVSSSAAPTGANPARPKVLASAATTPLAEATRETARQISTETVDLAGDRTLNRAAATAGQVGMTRPAANTSKVKKEAESTRATPTGAPQSSRAASAESKSRAARDSNDGGAGRLTRSGAVRVVRNNAGSGILPRGAESDTPQAAPPQTEPVQTAPGAKGKARARPDAARQSAQGSGSNRVRVTRNAAPGNSEGRAAAGPSGLQTAPVPANAAANLNAMNTSASGLAPQRGDGKRQVELNQASSQASAAGTSGAVNYEASTSRGEPETASQEMSLRESIMLMKKLAAIDADVSPRKRRRLDPQQAGSSSDADADQLISTAMDYFNEAWNVTWKLNARFAAYRAADFALRHQPANLEHFRNEVSPFLNCIPHDHPWTPPRLGRDKARLLQLYEDLMEEIMQQQTAFVMRTIPDADPQYLEQLVRKENGDQRGVCRLMQRLLKDRNYPKKEDFERRQQRAELIRSFFSVENILELHDDPLTYFLDTSRVTSEAYRRQALMQLRADFPSVHANRIHNIFQHFNYHYAPSHNYLNSLRTRRLRVDPVGPSLTAVPDDGDLNFLQELAFVRLEPEITRLLEANQTERRLQLHLARENRTLRECPICCEEELLDSDFQSCQQGHQVCNSCIKRHSEILIGEMKCHIGCIFPNCNAEYSMETLQRVLRRPVYERLVSRLQAEEIQAAGIEGLESCPFCVYAEVPPEEDRLFRCLNPSCRKVSCRACRKTDHLPLSCEEYGLQDRMRDYVETRMTEALLRECPNCHKRFVKTSGCNKMTCSCGTTICYVCRSRINGYEHFQVPGGCPLSSNTERLHEQERRRGAAAAQAELAAQSQCP